MCRIGLLFTNQPMDFKGFEDDLAGYPHSLFSAEVSRETGLHFLEVLQKSAYFLTINSNEMSIAVCHRMMPLSYCLSTPLKLISVPDYACLNVGKGATENMCKSMHTPESISVHLCIFIAVLQAM